MKVVAAETKFAPAGIIFLSVTEYPIASTITPHHTAQSNQYATIYEILPEGTERT